MRQTANHKKFKLRKILQNLFIEIQYRKRNLLKFELMGDELSHKIMDGNKVP